jgi:hypothetical protein
MPRSTRELPAFTEEHKRRYWAKVNKTDPSGCWMWSGLKSKEGYGRFYFERRRFFAHRISWFWHFGAIPDEVLICHTCDQPSCVRPDHLWVGNDTANIADRHRKGRTASGDRHGSRIHPERVPRGERNGSVTCPESRPRGEGCYLSKLIDNDIREIRRLSASGLSYPSIAVRYNVTPENIGAIVRRRTWRHVT